MVKRKVITETRTIEQLRKDYEIEKELASRLRNASKDERRVLYSSLYDEMFRRTPLHPQIINKASPEIIEARVRVQMKFLRRFLKPDFIFLEIGPGDCSLSIAVTKYVHSVVGIDVSSVITNNLKLPSNFKLIVSDGSSIPVTKNSINIAYSNQLMEHLHPDDAYEQLKNVYKVLTNNGIYICSTPNKLSGPHDISKYFEKVASGFHLKEYSTCELVKLFKKAGFKSCDIYVGTKGIFVHLPYVFTWILETLLSLTPYYFRMFLVKGPLRIFLGILIVGKK